MIDTKSYDRFKELRQQYYIAGRSLLVNNLFGPAGINLGYAIELSLKFILAFKDHKKGLRNHNIENYYNQVVDQKYIPPLNVSPDFLKFVNERLNTRYPIMIAENLETHEAESRQCVFPIDMLHCYDDFILQLDDAITEAVKDPKSSIGFRCCRELTSINGRIFFHCNDHAFQRIDNYLKKLSEFRDNGDNLDQIKSIIENKKELWNFKGLMAFRPWGPKTDWSPAAEFSFPPIGSPISSAKWAANNVGVDMYLSSMQIVLPAGTYDCKISDKIIKPKNKDQTLIKIEKWLNIIGDSFDSPIWKDGTFVYEKITVRHVAYLKAVRAVSSLHSLSLLYKNGLAIDGGSILRCLFDCLDEIYFLLENYPDTSETVDKYVQHFESTSLISNAEKTETVKSKKVHSAKARTFENQLNFNDCRNSIRKIFETFSGYVHSSYPHIMEIYGGNDLTFHVRGVLNPQKLDEYTALFEAAIGSTETTLGFMALKLGLSELFKDIKENLS